jgi:hypothetical protein
MKHSRSITVLLTALATVTFAAGSIPRAAAAVAAAIPYQGHLTDAAGIDVDADLPVEVRLYDSVIAGIGEGVTNAHVLYAERHAAVHVAGGLFRIAIGEGTALDAKWTGLPVDLLATKENVYLELRIDGERLSRRQRIGSFPVAIKVARATYADTLATKPTITPTMVPAYDAAKITSGAFSAAQVPGLSAAYFSGSLNAGQLPVLDIGKFDVSAGHFIDPARLPAVLDAALVTGGPVAPGLLPSELLEGGEIVFGAGAIGHHEMMTLPAGFENSPCWIAYTPAVLKESIPFGFEYLDASFTNGTDHILSCEYYQESGNKMNCTGAYLYACMK